MKLKRAKALEWTCKLGSSLCKSEAMNKLLKWSDNPKTNALSADDNDWIICAGLHTDDDKLRKKLLATNIIMGVAIQCTSNITTLENYISYTLAKDSTYIEFSVIRMVIIMFNIEHGVTAVLNYINNNYKEITNLEGYSNDDLREDISSLAKEIRNKKQRDKLKTFIESNKVSLNGTLDEELADLDNKLKTIDEKLHPFKVFFDKNVTKKSDNSTDID
ncbi:hypothetical protein PV327_001738 [Microctonus hyperodae]|uniref:ERAP1-like C-terminal domain-containing protein n=1 Tax=Microctonus hyperodae TaxID=165561 RepID=A0AA39FE51_MICHY|nr:hypothetical protein PV327_001738 [Microctonus hyperodae]